MQKGFVVSLFDRGFFLREFDGKVSGFLARQIGIICSLVITVASGNLILFTRANGTNIT